MSHENIGQEETHPREGGVKGEEWKEGEEEQWKCGKGAERREDREKNDLRNGKEKYQGLKNDAQTTIAATYNTRWTWLVEDH